MLKPPALDHGLTSLLRLAGWPSKVNKAKKNGSTSICPKRLKEAELYKLHMEMAEIARPQIQALDEIDILVDDKDSREKLFRRSTDTLQMCCDKIKRITHERHRNILDIKFSPDIVEKLLSPSMFGDDKEKQLYLFGPTWI